jgi:hypothetical protein
MMETSFSDVVFLPRTMGCGPYLHQPPPRNLSGGGRLGQKRLWTRADSSPWERVKAKSTLTPSCFAHVLRRAMSATLQLQGILDPEDGWFPILRDFLRDSVLLTEPDDSLLAAERCTALASVAQVSHGSSLRCMTSMDSHCDDWNPRA